MLPGLVAILRYDRVETSLLSIYLCQFMSGKNWGSLFVVNEAVEVVGKLPIR